MTIAEIARLEALLETATSGEWNPEDVYSGEYTLRVEDCHLIAAMKNALPELLKAGARITHKYPVASLFRVVEDYQGSKR